MASHLCITPIADISVIGILVYLLISAPLAITWLSIFNKDKPVTKKRNTLERLLYPTKHQTKGKIYKQENISSKSKDVYVCLIELK